MTNTFGFSFHNSYSALPPVFYHLGAPAPVARPELVTFNDPLAATLGLDFSSAAQTDLAAIFAGNQLLAGMKPLSQAYAGHQFGHLAMLGDGRAHLLGEHQTPNGQLVDLQLKGSGRTPYSRSGDGRAALGPMLREYLISEAVHALGIPTSRSLAVVTTGETVHREQHLPGAILTRVAHSHLRVGTVEFAALQRDPELVSAVVDYTIQRHYPELQTVDHKALALLEAVMDRQIDLIVHWLRVGFIHGVMNTDNMTLSGETIDYGPCAFMDAYHPGTVFSSIDHHGRYAYGNQPIIAQWNLARLAQALLPLIDSDLDQAAAQAETTLAPFKQRYQERWTAMMGRKLGLAAIQPEDTQLITDLLSWMQQNHADFTNTFRDLMDPYCLSTGVYAQPAFQQWLARYQGRLSAAGTERAVQQQLMQQHNPTVIPRNHLVEQALTAAENGDMAPFQTLLAVIQNPYQQTDVPAVYRSPAPPSERVYQTFCGT